jgi:hypothetical protein
VKQTLSAIGGTDYEVNTKIGGTDYEVGKVFHRQADFFSTNTGDFSESGMGKNLKIGGTDYENRWH